MPKLVSPTGKDESQGQKNCAQDHGFGSCAVHQESGDGGRDSVNKKVQGKHGRGKVPRPFKFFQQGRKDDRKGKAGTVSQSIGGGPHDGYIPAIKKGIVSFIHRQGFPPEVFAADRKAVLESGREPVSGLHGGFPRLPSWLLILLHFPAK